MATLEEWKTNLKAANSSISKMVDGVTITLTTDEYNAQIDEWAQNSFDSEVEDTIRNDGGASASYAKFRQEAYPSIGDQLDMQYNDAINGTTTWKDAITAIKSKYTKG
tara:strand:+ start:427 stop:750 length:324 start_codon:yes stop_codon:yes gene_type:complete